MSFGYAHVWRAPACGPGLVLNTLNQNRVFVGVKQGLGRSWSFDLGYMLEAFASDAPPEVAAAGPQPAASKLAGAAR